MLLIKKVISFYPPHKGWCM